MTSDFCQYLLLSPPRTCDEPSAKSWSTLNHGECQASPARSGSGLVAGRARSGSDLERGARFHHGVCPVRRGFQCTSQKLGECKQ